MQIAVLGMHRSGTSALTRLLGFIGCHLGDDRYFNAVRPDNPAGDWERTEVWALNEDVLAALDATWCRVAGFDPARLSAAARSAFEARVRAIVAGLGAREPWAIKDPRMCLTFPVWRPALEAPVCVLVHRDPLAVARSLKRRDGFPLAVGLALWETHVLGALRHSRGLPRLSVDHAALMRDPAAALRILRRGLEAAGVRGLTDADEAAVRGFVDPALQHAGSEPDEHEAYLNPAQRRLASAVADDSALVWDDVPALSEAARDLLEGYFGLQRERDDAAADRDRRAAELQHKAEEVERLAEAHRQAEAGARRAEALARENDELRRNAAALERRHEELGRSNEALEREGASLRLANEELRRTHEDLERRCAALARNVEELTRRNGELEGLYAGEQSAGRARAERDERRLRRAEDDLDALMGQGTELQRLIELILASRRFRLGDGAGEFLGRVLLRPTQPRAAEHARRIVGGFSEACDAVARRRAEPTGD